MARPDIFDYSDYRSFLKDWFDHKRQERLDLGRSPYSHRLFAQEAGQKNSGILLGITSGKKNLTDDLLQAFRKPLGLDEHEAEFLALLLGHERAADDEQKAQNRLEALTAGLPPPPKVADRQTRSALDTATQTLARARAARVRLDHDLIGARKMHRAKILEEQQIRLSNAWSTVAIEQLSRCAAFRGDPDWISKAFDGRVTPEIAEKTLALLIENGLLVRDEAGRYLYQDSCQRSPDEIKAELIANYYRGVFEQAGVALERGLSERDYAYKCRLSSATFAVPASAIPIIREGVLEIRRRLFSFFEGIEGEPDIVYQVWLQVFPISEFVGADGG